MSEDLPEVIFRYAYPLDMNRRRHFEREGKEGYPGIDVVKEKKKDWQELWADLNENNQVMKEIADMTGILHPRDIQAYVIGGGLNPMSKPLILPVQNKLSNRDGSREELILHELLHVILDDTSANPEIQNYRDYIHDTYSEEESVKTMNHIIIYAVLIKLFEQFLPDLKVDDFIKEEWKAYQRALKIVREEGPDEIIEKFQELTQ